MYVASFGRKAVEGAGIQPLKPLSFFKVTGKRAKKERNRKEMTRRGEIRSLSEEMLPICVPAKV